MIPKLGESEGLLLSCESVGIVEGFEEVELSLEVGTVLEAFPVILVSVG